MEINSLQFRQHTVVSLPDHQSIHTSRAGIIFSIWDMFRPLFLVINLWARALYCCCISQVKSDILVNAVEPCQRALLIKHILFSPMLKILIAVSFLGVLIFLSQRQCPKFGRGDGFVSRPCLPLLPNVSVLEATTATVVISSDFFFWMQPTRAVKNLPTINTNHLLLLLKTLPCVGCCHG